MAPTIGRVALDNGFHGSIPGDWVAPPPQNIQGENRVFLISDLYVLDGYVKDYKKMYECYWAHYAAYSDGKGGECWRVGVKGGLGHKCGRIRGDDEREKFADLV